MNEREIEIAHAKELISAHGGPTALATRLSLKKQGGTQQVSNWLKRGIPAKIKLKHPDIFLRQRARKAA